MKIKQIPVFEDLKGKTLTEIKNIDNESLFFCTADGETYKLYHEQDCCESVYIEDICGDFDDLIGEPLIMAEEVIHINENPEEVPEQEYQEESFTWTFYKLGTKKGSVTIRWYGDSNGYYSESVDFCQIAK